ncbi:hypothetical protein [Nostoc sp.]
MFSSGTVLKRAYEFLLTKTRKLSFPLPF